MKFTGKSAVFNNRLYWLIVVKEDGQGFYRKSVESSFEHMWVVQMDE